MTRCFWLSGESSTLKPSPLRATTVRQAPLIAILSPSLALSFAFIVRVEPTKLLTVAISLMSPVKIVNPF